MQICASLRPYCELSANPVHVWFHLHLSLSEVTVNGISFLSLVPTLDVYRGSYTHPVLLGFPHEWVLDVSSASTDRIP